MSGLSNLAFYHHSCTNICGGIYIFKFCASGKYVYNNTLYVFQWNETGSILGLCSALLWDNTPHNHHIDAMRLESAVTLPDVIRSLRTIQTSSSNVP